MGAVANVKTEKHGGRWLTLKRGNGSGGPTENGKHGNQQGERAKTTVQDRDEETAGETHLYAREMYDDNTTSVPIRVCVEQADHLRGVRKRRRLVCLNYNHCARHLSLHDGEHRKFHAQHMPKLFDVRPCGEERLTCSESFEHYLLKNILAHMPHLLCVTFRCACCKEDKLYTQPEEQGSVEVRIVLDDTAYSVDVMYTKPCGYELVKHHRFSLQKYLELHKVQLHYPEIDALELIGKLREKVQINANDTYTDVIPRLQNANVQNIPMRDSSALLRVCPGCRDTNKVLYISVDCTKVFWQLREGNGLKFFKGFAPFGKYMSFSWSVGPKITTVHVQQIDSIHTVVDTLTFQTFAVKTNDTELKEVFPPEIRMHKDRYSKLLAIVNEFRKERKEREEM